MTGFPQKSAPCSGCSRRASGSPRLAELAVRSRHPETPFANQAIESQRERGSAPRSDASFVPGKSFRPVKEAPSNPPVMRAFPPSRIVLLSRHAPCVDNGRRALRSRRSHYRQEILMNKDRGQQKNAQGSQEENQFGGNLRRWTTTSPAFVGSPTRMTTWPRFGMFGCSFHVSA